MIGLSYEDIVAKITEVTGKTTDEIKSRVKEKLAKLSGLISTEGAAHIVANELGVDLIEIIRKHGLKINKLAAGMRGVCAIGKVIKVYETRSFKKEAREGKVGSFLIGDETGVIRIVLWDTNQIELITNGTIKEDTIVKLTNSHIRENNGYKELHLGIRSEILINPEGVSITTVAPREVLFQRREVKDLKPGEFASVAGTIVQLFEPRFYPACPECGKKTEGQCNEHGRVLPKQMPVLNFYLDDGTGGIRTVAFRNNVYAILGTDEQSLLEMQNNGESFESLKRDILGKQIMVAGRINKNEMFDRVEMAVNQVMEFDPAALANPVKKEIEQHDV